MCLRPSITRRYCTHCKTVTSWKIDPAINHSRCLVCKSDSRFSRKITKHTQEEPKMNKQYVKEQIDIAIKELRAEYDAVIGNIYQCPDCGAVAFKNGEHICFKAAPAVEKPPLPRKTTLIERVYDVLPIGAPSADIEVFGVDSDYTPAKIAANVAPAHPGSVKAAISTLWLDGKIKRRAAALRVAGGKRDREGGVPGFVYWRTA